MSYPPRTFPPVIDRILDRCVAIGDCWVFQQGKGSGKYARVRESGGGKVQAHRVTYEFFIGPIPGSLTYDHLCEVTLCVNPYHGDLVPRVVNSERATRGMSPINRAKESCPQGHPYSGENLKLDRKGWRWCRACSRDANRRYRKRKKEEAHG